MSIVLGLTSAALGQLEPDETLGEERSQVRTLDAAIELIEGGATRGRNLFHSFREFNVDAGQGAYFIHLPGIENILSRVTGENRSQINGVLGVRGFENGGFVGSAANLFLINPNGIVFGPNSSLDVGGSFVATTADRIQFGEQGFFSATNPETPGLLTVNPSAYFFNQLPIGSIANSSRALAGSDPSGFALFGLRVPDGQNLLLLGGNVTMNGGRLNALGGRVEIGAVGGTGIVTLNADGSLSFPNGLPRSNVFLDTAAIDVAAGDGGTVGITAQNLDLRNSLIQAGIRPGLGDIGNQAGDISVNTTGRLQLAETSFITNGVYANAVGNSGDIRINTDSLFLANGSQIVSIVFGRGNASNVIINARESAAFDGTSADGRIVSLVSSQVRQGAVGNGGNVEITTSNLSVTGGAQLVAGSFGRGNAGNIIINARESATFDGTSADGRFFSGAGSRVESTGTGNGGNVEITTNTLHVIDGAQVTASTLGRGNAGNVIINARESATFDGTSTFGYVSGASTSVDSAAVGNGGNVEITTGNLSVTGGAQLVANIFGRGNAGNIIINARESATFDGTSADGRFFSGAGSRVESTGTGNGGNVEITTGTLRVTNGGSITAATLGKGNAGNVTIAANEATFANSVNRFFLSGANSQVRRGASGNGGDVEIMADILRVLGGAQLSAGSFGQGNAGDVVLQVRDRILIDGESPDGYPSGVFSTIEREAIGQGGDIRISTGSLSMRNGALIDTSTFSRGNAGNVIINARDTISLDGTDRINARNSVSPDEASSNGFPTTIFSAAETNAIGNGGDIRISTGSFVATNGARLNAFTRGRGNAGNITIAARDRVIFDGLSADNASFSGAISTIEASGRGAGGDIRISARSLAITNGAQISARTAGQGNAGNVIISATDRVVLDGIGSSGFSSGVFTSTGPSATGRGGRITVTTPEFRVNNGAVVNAQTTNNRPGGSVVIEAEQFTALNGGQVITTALSRGQAGNITLNADRILLSGTDATYSNRLEQFGRTVVVNQGNRSGLFANTRSNSTGNGGRITVNSNNLTLENGAIISAQSQGTGTAGEIRLNVSEQLQLTDSDIVTNAPRSAGGDITVNSSESSGLILLRGDSDITTNSQGNGGNIELRGSGIIAFDDSDILARSQDARGGNITLAPFFSANPAFESEAPFDGNGRVDVNADGSIASGTITTPDTSLIQNSLTDLPESAIDTDNLVANSCVVRSQEQSGTFIIAGAEGLPQRPGDAPLPSYATGTVRSAEEAAEESADAPTWQMGDPIVEPQGMYRLQDGRMVLSREC